MDHRKVDHCVVTYLAGMILCVILVAVIATCVHTVIY